MELPLTHMPQPVKKQSDCTLDMMNTSSPKHKMINLFESKRAGGFWPFADQPGPDGQLAVRMPLKNAQKIYNSSFDYLCHNSFQFSQ